MDASRVYERMGLLGDSTKGLELALEFITSAHAIFGSEDQEFARRKLERPRHAPALPIIRPPEGCEGASGRTPKRMTYRPLPSRTSIRLLRVQPLRVLKTQLDLFEPPIRCSLEVADLDDDPSYDALSYTWGDPCTLYLSPEAISSEEAWRASPFDIEIDGKPVSVGTNLYTALLAIRVLVTQSSASATTTNRPTDLPETSGRCWIDALCINQDDMQEKNHQVRMMARIYHQASLVLAWLGGSDQYSQEAMNALVPLARREVNPIPKEMRQLDIDSEDSYKTLNIPPISYTNWIAVYMLLSRAWFKRAWIVQEMAHARRAVVVCGLRSLPLDGMVDSLLKLDRSGWLKQLSLLVGPLIENHRDPSDEDNIFVRHQSEVRLYRSRPAKPLELNVGSILIETRMGAMTYSGSIKGIEAPQRSSLHRLLAFYRYTEAGDPRDNVYAIVSLARLDDASSLLAIDYGKHVRDVFLETAVSIMTSSGNLDVFSHHAPDSKLPRSSQTLMLPSWVPDFSIYHPPNSDIHLQGPFSASAGLDRADFMCVQGNTLKLSGLRLAQVKTIWQMSDEYIPQLQALLDEIAVPRTDPRTDTPDYKPISMMTTASSPSHHEHDRRQRLRLLSEVIFMDSIEGATAIMTPVASVELLAGWLESTVIREQLYLASQLGLAALRSYGQSRMPVTSPLPTSETSFDFTSARAQLQQKYESVRAILGKSPVLDTTNGKANSALPPDYLDFEVLYSVLLNPLHRLEASQQFITEYLSRTETSSDNALAFSMVSKRMTQYDLFATNLGHVGLCPKATHVGDEVWIVAGGDVPLLLRPASTPGQYRLVGEAYVHGVMRGEAVAEVKSSDLQSVMLI